eukprot:jgi/Picsp_1/1896/NSC_05362-R1_endcodes part of kinesin
MSDGRGGREKPGYMERFVKPIVVIRPPNTSELAVCTGEEDEIVVEKRGASEEAEQQFRIQVGKVSKDDGERGGDKRTTANEFWFDHVYGYGANDLDLLCVEHVEPLLKACLGYGEHGAIVAYGQTGAGKSYVCGTEAVKSASVWRGSLGSFVSRRLFELVRELKLTEVEVTCSMVEIYKEALNKEQVFDLLDGFNRKKIARSYAAARHHVVGSEESLFSKLREGAMLRNTDRTSGNVRSSRSHAIFTVTIRHSENLDKDVKRAIAGKFMIVDLAGAEAATQASAGSQLYKQGAGINVGLSALQTVINDIASEGKSVQYRLSRLTYELKSALGGDTDVGCNAVFIGCIAPMEATRSLNTLQYLKNASKIKNFVGQNVSILSESKKCRNCKILRSKLDMLVSQLEDKESRDVKILSQEEYEGLLSEIQGSKSRVFALEEIIKVADKTQEELTLENQSLQSEILQLEELLQKDKSLSPLTPEQPKLTLPPSDEDVNMKRNVSLLVEKPGIAALSISPLIAAAESKVELSAAEDTKLQSEEVYLPQECSNLDETQWKTLQSIVNDQLKGDADESESNEVLLRKERTALLMSLRVYNEYLGIMKEERDLARAAFEESKMQLHQAAKEKVQYVELTAEYMKALDVSQNDVWELQHQVDAMKPSPKILSPNLNPGTLFSRFLPRRNSQIPDTVDSSGVPPSPEIGNAKGDSPIVVSEPKGISEKHISEQAVEKTSDDLRDIRPHPIVIDEQEDVILLTDPTPQPIVDLVNGDETNALEGTQIDINGGVDASKIPATIGQSISETFKVKNSHWFSKRKN